MNPFRFSWQLTRRDWRAGELRLLVAALVIAVASTCSVGFFVDRMRQALSLEARQLLGADLLIASDHPIGPEWDAQLASRGLRSARTVNFPSMASAGAMPQLAAIKAVSQAYPLRGKLRVAAAPNQPDEAARGVPEPGTIWADAQLLQALSARVGDQVELGQSLLRIDRVLTLEPDRGANFINFAPRALMRLDDLAATGLVQPASRVTYRLLVSGESAAVAGFENWAREALGRGMRIESLETGRPELRNTLDRAEQFLALVALLSALIAAVAIGLSARRFAERHLDGCAVMRAIGVRQRTLLTVLGLELLWVALAGGITGVALGWLVHLALVQVLAPMIGLPLPPAGMLPVFQGLATGLVLLLGFGAWPFLRLAGVPALRVLRRELGQTGASPLIALALALSAFIGLLLWFSADLRLALIAIGGFAAGAAVFVLFTWGMMQLVGGLRHRGATVLRSPAIRLALASWSRRRSASIAQMVALAIGLMALLLLTVVRTDLIDGWRRASPPDAPNRFAINIQPGQEQGVVAALTRGGIGKVELYPMIRGRLVAINDRPVGPADYEGERARRLVDREFNLSYLADAPGHNRIIEGQWFEPQAMEVSIESGILSTLGLKLGDLLAFEVAGQRIEVRASSVRKLNWDSMKVNFFMILSPAALRDAPQTLITAYHQPAGRAPVDAELIREFPNLTIFDTGHLLRQVQTMLDQVVMAVQLLFLMTLAAGVVVLYTALAASRDERIREAALMRALGASRAQLARAQLWELGLSGGLAGLLASVGALTIGMLLGSQVFGFELEFRWSGVLAGTGAGMALALIAGWLGLRGVLRAPPLASLREA